MYRKDVGKTRCSKKFLFEVCCGDTDLIYFLKSVFGYAITGETTEQVFFIMHGTGANGKTTLINAIENVLRPYVCRMPIGVLMGKTANGSGKATPELARTISTRLVFASESNEGEVLNEAKIKNLTGGEEIIVRPLYKNAIQFSPTFKLFLDTNYLPQVKGLDYAIWRRIKVIPFRATFDARNADKDLMSKLKTREEAESILAFLIEGAVLYYQNKIVECKAVNDATSEFQFLCDTIGRFLSCRVNFGNDFEISATKLYQQYLKFCEEENILPVSSTDFGRILIGKGICKKHRRTGNFYVGITCEECEG